MSNNNILLSNRISSSQKNDKYFISYIDDDHKIKPLCIMLPKTIGYIKNYEGDMFFSQR